MNPLLLIETDFKPSGNELQQASFTGTVTTLDYIKNFGWIKYEANGREHKVGFYLISGKEFQRQKHGFKPKGHHFWVGDVVEFSLKPSPKNANIFIAAHVIFKHNELLDELVRKAGMVNHFFGKITRQGEQYFITELLTEIIFPLEFIEYEYPPADDELKKHFYFRLTHKKDAKKRAGQLIEKRFYNINHNIAHHIHHGTAFDAEVQRISANYIELSIPFFSMHGRIDIKNCKEDLKKIYRTLKEDEWLRVSIYRAREGMMEVKLAGYEYMPYHNHNLKKHRRHH